MSLSASQLLRFDQIHQLVTKQLEGTATEADQRSLEKAVSSDPEMRDEYIRSIQEVAHISARLVHSGPTNECTKIEDSKTSLLSTLSLVSDRLSRSMKHLMAWIAIIASFVFVAFLVTWNHDRDLRQQETGSSVTHSVADGSAASSSEPGSSVASGLAADGPDVLDAKYGSEVATLVECNSVVWAGNAVSELSRVTVGQELALRRGRIKLVFDSGVEALVLAPCRLNIQDRDCVYCASGRITAKASVAGRGFVIKTPVVRVTDLGTEFGMAISESGETEVVVFEGEVDVELNSTSGPSSSEFQPRRERLNQGEAAFVNSHGQSRRLVSIDNQRLPGVRDLAPLHQEQQVISAVRDNIVDRQPESRMFYRIVQAGLREDSQAFVDRSHQWNGLTSEGMPRELIGADYVMPFNDDKLVSDLRIHVSIARPATLYVFFSDNTTVPNWLSSGFVDTGLDLGLDEGANQFKPRKKLGVGPGVSINNTFSIWKREIDQPQELELGSFERPEGFKKGYNMYGVAAVAK